MLSQRPFQRSARLDEQAPIDGFVRHARLSSLRYFLLSQPEICLGDQSKISLLGRLPELVMPGQEAELGRKADSQAC